MPSPITTHVLDTSRGAPAAGVEVRLEAERGGKWIVLGEGATNADGRTTDLLGAQAALESGRYRLTFETGAYFKNLKAETFYPSVQVVFEVRDRRHHHVPLLISPYGYSTYRGS